ncbi:unnamed protein product [Rodentolepis nana]|uniref:ShKT domain-containing protein n=1 Tax=Rodentolepis nana TaxID=102285 RepID=A0A0R3TRA7_RODNA|nr:unnamed protein product [Rodentolepis nana]
MTTFGETLSTLHLFTAPDPYHTIPCCLTIRCVRMLFHGVNSCSSACEYCSTNDDVVDCKGIMTLGVIGLGNMRCLATRAALACYFDIYLYI